MKFEILLFKESCVEVLIQAMSNSFVKQGSVSCITSSGYEINIIDSGRSVQDH